MRPTSLKRIVALLPALGCALATTGCFTIELHNRATPQYRSGEVWNVRAWKRSSRQYQIAAFYRESDPRVLELEFTDPTDTDPALTLVEWRRTFDPGFEEIPALKRMPLSKELDVVVWSTNEDRVRVCRGENCHAGPNLYCWPKDTTEERLASAAWLFTPISAVMDLVTSPYQLWLWGNGRLPDWIESACP